jgi:hypothetical protein
MTRYSRICACLLALAAVTAAPSAFAACTHPKPPASLPDGATATKDEMVAANQLVKQYIAEMDTYLQCIDAESPKTPSGKMSDEEKAKLLQAQKMVVEKHNAAVAEEEAMRDDWHNRLQAYKDKQPKP